jgi:hypothetical protein
MSTHQSIKEHPMVTITKSTGNTGTPESIVILDTTEDAETFLDKLSGNYWGIPGFLATRTPGRLEIKAQAYGEGWRILSTYTAKADAA